MIQNCGFYGVNDNKFNVKWEVIQKIIEGHRPLYVSHSEVSTKPDRQNTFPKIQENSMNLSMPLKGI